MNASSTSQPENFASDFSRSLKTCFAKYAVFAGRANRTEFWMFVLFGILVDFAEFLLFGNHKSAYDFLSTRSPASLFLFRKSRSAHGDCTTSDAPHGGCCSRSPSSAFSRC
jgi:hypothetical protein